MKKLLTIVLALALMLSTCALADGAELLLNNLTVSLLENDQASTLDFSGIDLRLAYADDPTGVRIGLDAAGKTLINAVATVTNEAVLFTLDGLDNVYCVPMEDVQAAAAEITSDLPAIDVAEFTAALETLCSELESFFAGVESVEGEPVEIYGEIYDTQTITFTPEQLQQLALIFADFAEALPAEFQQAILEDSEYTSLREALNADPNPYWLECSTHTLDDQLALDFVMGHEQYPENKAHAQIVCIPGTDAETGMNCIQVSGALMTQYGEEMTEIFNASMIINLNPETGALYDLSGGVYFPVDGAVIPSEENMDDVLADETFLTENYDGIYFGALSPEADPENGLWAAYIADMDESVYMHFACSDPEAEYGYYEFLMEEEDTIAMLSLQQTAENSASIYCAFSEGGSGVDISFDAAINEVDATWTAIDAANAINVLEMTEQQATTLSLQAGAVGMNALSGLMTSNETIAAIAASLMGMAG